MFKNGKSLILDDVKGGTAEMVKTSDNLNTLKGNLNSFISEFKLNDS